MISGSPIQWWAVKNQPDRVFGRRETEQKLTGNGTAWVQLAGEITEYDLPAGQSLLIHPGHLALFDASMQLEFTSIKGIKSS